MFFFKFKKYLGVENYAKFVKFMIDAKSMELAELIEKL